MAPVRKRAQSRGARPEGRKKRKGIAGTDSDVVGMKNNKRDEEILSEEEEEREGQEGEAVVSDEEEEEELDLETADEKRLRIAKAYLDRTRQAAAADAEDDEDGETAEQRMGARDSMVADLLQQEQLEASGRSQRKLASRVVQPAVTPQGAPVGRRHRQSVTAICVTDDDDSGFSVSKDGLIVSPLTRARAVNTGNNKKRKIVHRTSSGRRKDVESKTVPLRNMKAAASLDLSDPSQLTMKEIIRRAEAIERAKAREEAAKKAEGKEKRGSSSTTSAAAESPVAQDTPAPSVLTPQVQIVNGRIVINQQSLVVAAQASTREDTDSYRRVEEDRPRLNYNSYSNRTPVERWKAEDTDLFYKALQQFGTDFELIQNLFPGRTRRQVKAKFKNEEKLNPLRLADALGHKTQDQSHHYRAIIEMLKTEKPDGENEDDILLESLLRPAVTDESVTTQQTPGTQASSSAEKVDEVVNLEAPANAVVLEKMKPDLRTPSASEAIVSILPESEVAGNDDPPASEATGNLVSSYQSNSNSSANPLGSYGKQTNPLGNYGKESLSGNPLGSYAKNPLGVYK